MLAILYAEQIVRFASMIVVVDKVPISCISIEEKSREKKSVSL